MKYNSANDQNLRQNIRAILVSELEDRCRKNPRYSIRAFASFLDVDHSSLAKMISGKRVVGDKVARKFAARLGYFAPASKVKRGPAERESAGSSFKVLPQDVFELVPDWYHFAILELLKVPDVRHDVRVFSRRLGVSHWQIQTALGQLQKANLIEIRSDGKWIDLSSGSTSSINSSTPDRLKRLQVQFVEKSLQALQEIPRERRSHTSLTVALSHSRFEEAKSAINSFRGKMNELLSQDAQADDVYVLNIGFFPVS